MKKALLGLGIMAAATALPAAAQMSAPSLSSAYVGVSIGQSKAKDWCNGIAGTGVSCDDEDTAWKVFAGYQFHRNFAAELGYTKMGKVTASLGTLREEAKATAWEISALGAWPVTEQFSVFGRLGLYRAEVKDETNFAGNVEHTNNDLTYGLGLQFAFTRNVAVRAEWQRYADVGGGDIDKSNVDVIGISALWKF